MNYIFYKRFFDFFLSLILVIILLPLYLIISLSIYFSSPGPIIYRGIRAGKNGKLFKINKFRTMVLDADKIGGFSTAKNDIRLIKGGRFYRKYKLDELPQIYNVLIGDMSFVGPRPQVFFYTNKYKGKYRDILKIKPGITDLATIIFSDMDQTLGTTNVDEYYEKVIEPRKNKLRLKYVKNISFFLDTKILICTFLLLLGFNPYLKIE